MHTISSRVESRSISIAAAPSEVFAFVSDPRNLPQWAPGFAPTIEPSGDDWVVHHGTDQLKLTVRTSPEHGTVDFLRTENLLTGGFTRVYPNGDGAEYQFTLFFPTDTPEAAIAEQLKFIDEELVTVRKFCEEQSAA